MNSARRFSNSSLKRPVVSQPSSDASTMIFSSSAPITLPEGGTARRTGLERLRRQRDGRILLDQLRDLRAQCLESCAFCIIQISFRVNR